MNPLRFCGIALLLLNLAYHAPSQAASSDTPEVRRILSIVKEGRCKDAVEELSQRLQSKQPELQLLAGTLYESGICLEKSWEKATQLYQQAALGGLRDAALPRLVSIYALGYRDPAAALWWASQGSDALPKDCLPVAHPQKQSSAFIEELQQWPDDRLKSCTYYAGVLSRIKYKSSMRLVLGRASDEVPVDVKIDVPKGIVEWYSVIDKKTVVSQISPDRKKINMSTAPSEDDDSFLRYLWWMGLAVLEEFGPSPAQAPSWDNKNTIHMERAIRSANTMEFITISP